MAKKKPYEDEPDTYTDMYGNTWTFEQVLQGD